MGQEPFNLKRWKHGQSPNGRLFTCARPGRSQGKRVNRIEDGCVDRWVKGLPRSPQTVIVSLLGTKSRGRSEFICYSFRSEFDTAVGRPTFQAWLDGRHGSGQFRVIEHPTVDYKRIPADTLHGIEENILSQLKAGHTVVLIDSGGESRTGQVCRSMGFHEEAS